MYSSIHYNFYLIPLKVFSLQEYLVEINIHSKHPKLKKLCFKKHLLNKNERELYPITKIVPATVKENASNLLNSHGNSSSTHFISFSRRLDTLPRSFLMK